MHPSFLIIYYRYSLQVLNTGQEPPQVLADLLHEIGVGVLHREVQHADANAHEACVSARLESRAAEQRVRAAEERAEAKEARERERAAELDEARQEALKRL